MSITINAANPIIQMGAAGRCFLWLTLQILAKLLDIFNQTSSILDLSRSCVAYIFLIFSVKLLGQIVLRGKTRLSISYLQCKTQKNDHQQSTVHLIFSAACLCWISCRGCGCPKSKRWAIFTFLPNFSSSSKSAHFTFSWICSTH